MLSWLYFGAPIGLYALLVALPRGRAALKGAIGVACLLVALWLALWLLPQTDLVQSDQLQSLGFFALLGLSASWFIASTLQVLRLRLPASAPPWIWPLCAVITLGAVGLLVRRFLGL